MNHQGKFLKRIKRIYLFPILIGLVMTGCAGKPVQVEYPIGHPANPGALEMEFTPPPNPFKGDVGARKMESTTESMIKHKTHDESGQKKIQHDMGTKKSGHGRDDNSHKEHSK